MYILAQERGVMPDSYGPEDWHHSNTQPEGHYVMCEEP